MNYRAVEIRDEHAASLEGGYDETTELGSRL